VFAERAGVRGLIEIRLHGRGGQGTVVASLVLARAAMLEGRSVQAFPEFGVERRGAPVTAFLRIAQERIPLRCRVERPDHVLVLDPALLPMIELPTGRGGAVVVNSPLAPDALELPVGWRVATVDGTRLARAHALGSGALPIVNAPMAGAFARATALVGRTALLSAIREMVPVSPDENVAAAREAWELVRGDLPDAGAAEVAP
jgi:pyruvate ferredoxin oxidoreductase gamma subunit/2-oxoisovalerate ferredoxin oxidoreductase gamma subunit